MKRLVFHFFNFVILCLTIFLAVYVYFKFSYASFGWALGESYKFIAGRDFHLILIAIVTYFLSYLSGLIKYTIEDKYFRMVVYFSEVFKFFLILVMVAFMEFLIFYESARIGRLIYVNFFIIYSLYYLVYFWVRSQRDRKSVV